MTEFELVSLYYIIKF